MEKIDISTMTRIVGDEYGSNDVQEAGHDFHGMFLAYGARPYYLIAEEEGIVIGFGGFREAEMDPDTAEMFWVTVDKQHRGHGVGTELVKKLIEEIKKKYILVLLSTDKPEFYERLGFKQIHHITVESTKYSICALDL